MTLISFQVGRQLPQDKVHLVIIDSDTMPGAPARGQPRFSEHGDWTTAAWTDGRLTYMLMAPGDTRSVLKFL